MKNPRIITALAIASLGALSLFSNSCTSSQQMAPQQQTQAPRPAGQSPSARPVAVTPTAPQPAQQPRPNQGNGTVVALTAANFDAVINRPGAVVLVDFAADWCGPCRQLAPTIDRVASQFGGQAIVARVDVDANEAIALRYGVEALPTLMYFKNGRPQATTVGPASEQAISAQIQQLLR